MIGEALGNYVIEQPLGAGGMGHVYLGVHRRIGRRVAIKLLLPEYSASPALLARFFTEARATSLIDHPGIVQILDCDIHTSGRAYIIMEYLHGESLRASLARVGRLTDDIPAAMSIGAQVAEAVGAAHDKGIIHRDLKPDNTFILMPSERERVPVKVLDFGVAKLLTPDSDVPSHTRTGNLLGTPLYMSPEQCRSAGAVDHRSDIYSLGCILFEMMCGRPPFAHQGVTDLLIAHATHAPPTPTSLGVHLPEGLEELMLRMLLKDPAQRPSSMVEVALALRTIAARLPPARRPFSAQPPSVSSPQSRTAVLPAASPVYGTPPQQQRRPATAVGGFRAQTPNFDPVTQTTLEHSTGTMDRPDSVSRPRRTRRGLLVAGLLGVAALAVTAVIFSDELTGAGRHGGDSTAVSPEGSPGGKAAVTSPPAAAPVTQKPAPPAPEPEKQMINVEVYGAPGGLSATVDNVPAALPLRLPRDNAVHNIVFSAPGFEPETRVIEASKNQAISLALKEKDDRQDARARPPRGTPTRRKPKQNKFDPIIDL